MTPEQFCYWLQGFGELTPEPPTPEQWQAIKAHLDAVFRKVTPLVQGANPQAIPNRGLADAVARPSQQVWPNLGREALQPGPGRVVFAQQLRDQSNAHAAAKQQAYWGADGAVYSEEVVTDADAVATRSHVERLTQLQQQRSTQDE